MRVPRLSVVVPMYNEEGIVDEFHRRLENLRDILVKRFQFASEDLEILFVNDGSRDRTFERLQQLCCANQGYHLVNLSRNHGHQLAITAGIDLAKGQAVAVIDGDLQDPPETIAELYQKLTEGYDVVYAVRAKRKGESVFKLFTASAFYRVLRRLTRVEIPVDTGDFRIMSRRVVNVLKSMRERHRFIRGMVSWIGFKQTGVEYERQERFVGETKYPLSKMFKLAFDGITSFSSIPLKLASYVGVAAALIGFLYLGYVLIMRTFLGSSQLEIGWSSLISAILFMGGVQLISLGFIGEYLGRVHDESKNRPLYIVEHVYSTDDSQEGPSESEIRGAQSNSQQPRY